MKVKIFLERQEVDSGRSFFRPKIITLSLCFLREGK